MIRQKDSVFADPQLHITFAATTQRRTPRFLLVSEALSEHNCLFTELRLGHIKCVSVVVAAGMRSAPPAVVLDYVLIWY